MVGEGGLLYLKDVVVLLMTALGRPHRDSGGVLPLCVEVICLESVWVCKKSSDFSSIVACGMRTSSPRDAVIGVEATL